MKNKKFALVVLTAGLSVLSCIPAFAGQWKQDSKGWWYQEDNGSYPASTWKEINGKQYYFGADGYMLANTTTPDGYTVNGDGAWTVNGVVQEQKTESANTNLTNTQATADLSCLKYPLQHKEVISGNVFITHENVGIERYLGVYQHKPTDFVYEFVPFEAAILTDGTLHSMDQVAYTNRSYDIAGGELRVSATTWKFTNGDIEKQVSIEKDGDELHLYEYNTVTKEREETIYYRIEK